MRNSAIPEIHFSTSERFNTNGAPTMKIIINNISFYKGLEFFFFRFAISYDVQLLITWFRIKILPGRESRNG